MSTTYAITNVTIIQAPGRKIDAGIVIVKDGLIESVGKNIPVPPGAITIKGDSMYLYAGFIDGLSRTGVDKPQNDASLEKPKDPGNPSPERAGITPYINVRDLMNVADRSLGELRSQGFTTAHVVPHGVFFPGKGAVVSLGGMSAKEMIVVNDASFYTELSWNGGAYPSTVMGAMAKWRELYKQAVAAKSYQALYVSNRAGLERPVSDKVLEAFYPVIDKRIPVFFKEEKVVDIHRILALQAELGFPLIIGEMKEGWDVIDKLKTQNIKLFLSLELPEEKKDVKKAEVKEEKKYEVKEDKNIITEAEQQKLENRKIEFIAKYTSQAYMFQQAGLKFGFSTMSVKSKDIHANIRRMIAAGLSEENALAALTTHPAELLGLSDRLGTVEKGKIANLVITDRPYFSEKIKIRTVFVDGIPYECQKDGKIDKKIEIEGTWSLTTDTPDGKISLKAIFKKKEGVYTGSISGGKLPGPIPFRTVLFEGNKLKFIYSTLMDRGLLDVTVEGTVEGTAFKGAMNVGQYGSFSTDGIKDPKF